MILLFNFIPFVIYFNKIIFIYLLLIIFEVIALLLLLFKSIEAPSK